MTATPLDNPVWATLTGAHEASAQRHADVVRFASDVAPFVAVGSNDSDATGLETLVAPEETVFFLGQIPRLPRGWESVSRVEVVQFVAERPITASASIAVQPLVGAQAKADMLGLAGEIYPYFFRSNTASLGAFFGHRDASGRLMAMAGERMRLEGFQEISTLCARKGLRVEGASNAIVAAVQVSAKSRGQRLFAHTVVSKRGTRKVIERLAARLGFGARAVLPMVGVRRN